MIKEMLENSSKNIICSAPGKIKNKSYQMRQEMKELFFFFICKLKNLKREKKGSEFSTSTRSNNVF